MIEVTDLTADVQWAICGITYTIMCMCQWTLLKELLSIEWNSAQLLDDELSSGLTTDSCTTSWPVSLFLSLKRSGWEGWGTGEAWRLEGLRNGTRDKARWCLLKVRVQLVILLVFSSYVSGPAFSSLLHHLTSDLIWKTDSEESSLNTLFPWLFFSLSCPWLVFFSKGFPNFCPKLHVFCWRTNH